MVADSTTRCVSTFVFSVLWDMVGEPWSISLPPWAQWGRTKFMEIDHNS